MEIITNLKIDKRLSKETAEILFENENITSCCYSNIFNIINEFTKNNMHTNNLKIAYGYYGIPKIQMFRHCFLILKNSIIIDPTSVEIIDSDMEYHIFKTFSITEYLNTLNEIRNKLDTDEFICMEYSIPEEKIYYEYAVKNKIGINEFSYENFLKKYDMHKKLIVVNDEINKILNYKFDTSGRSLTFQDVKDLKNGSFLWIETDIPILAIKRNDKLYFNNLEKFYHINNIDLLFKVTEYKDL